MESCQKGPTVYRPYPRRLESLIVCRCHYITKAALSLQLVKTLSVDPDRLGFEPGTSRTQNFARVITHNTIIRF